MVLLKEILLVESFMQTVVAVLYRNGRIDSETYRLFTRTISSAADDMIRERAREVVE